MEIMEHGCEQIWNKKGWKNYALFSPTDMPYIQEILLDMKRTRKYTTHTNIQWRLTSGIMEMIEDQINQCTPTASLKA